MRVDSRPVYPVRCGAHSRRGCAVVDGAVLPPIREIGGEWSSRPCTHTQVHALLKGLPPVCVLARAWPCSTRLLGSFEGLLSDVRECVCVG
jgi:hypothetical protein